MEQAALLRVRHVEFSHRGLPYVVQVDPAREVWQIRGVVVARGKVGRGDHESPLTKTFTYGDVVAAPPADLIAAANEALHLAS